MYLKKSLILITAYFFLTNCALKGNYTRSELINCEIGIFNQNENTEIFQACVNNYRNINAEINKKIKQNNDPAYLAAENAKKKKIETQRLSVRKVGTKMSDYIATFGSPLIQKY